VIFVGFGRRTWDVRAAKRWSRVHGFVEVREN
jgi:hypothetical protein